jgi:hypothetical protein
MLADSVADVGCLSRILIFFHLGSRIQQEQKRGEEILYRFCSQKLTKYKKYYFDLISTIKFEPTKIFLTKKKKLLVSSKKNGFRILEPRSGKTHPGSRGKKSTGSRIRKTAG